MKLVLALVLVLTLEGLWGEWVTTNAIVASTRRLPPTCYEVGIDNRTPKFVIQYPTEFYKFCAPGVAQSY